MLSLSDWFTTISLLFGGCCSNAITMERLTSEYPHSGILITFFQFLVVSLYALPSQLVFSNKRTWLPQCRKRRVPLLPYFAQVALFLVLSLLNNAAFAYDIPMTVHIVFRSGGMIINMLLGWLLIKKRYTLKQVVAVCIVTIGIILTTLSASKPTSDTQSTNVAVSLYAQGVMLLALALLLSGLLGLSQDYVYTRYNKPFEAQAASDPLAQPSWQENMFYIHFLALPLFYFSRESITIELSRLGTSPSVSLASIPFVNVVLARTPDSPAFTLPSMLLYLLANTATQLFCVVGVNRLTGRVSSLTVTLILTVRKAVSLLLSVAVYGRQVNATMWVGAVLVFIGTIGYSTAPQTKVKAKDKTL